jgi:hypothetical protein
VSDKWRRSKDDSDIEHLVRTHCGEVVRNSEPNSSRSACHQRNLTKKKICGCRGGKNRSAMGTFCARAVCFTLFKRGLFVGLCVHGFGGMAGWLENWHVGVHRPSTPAVCERRMGTRGCFQARFHIQRSLASNLVGEIELLLFIPIFLSR